MKPEAVLDPRCPLKLIAGMTCLLFFSACGGDSSPAAQNDIASPSVSASPQPAPTQATSSALNPRAKYWEPMIRSADYTGQLAVMFNEVAGVRFAAGVIANPAGVKQSSELNGIAASPSAPRNDNSDTFRSKFNTNLKALNDLMAQHPEVTVRLGLPNIDQDFLDQRIAEIRALEGYPMTDWASFYIIDVMDADEALEILNDLDMDIVWFAHPVPMAYPTGIQIPNITPGPGQDYLNDLKTTGGLNVKAAWDAGLDGTGIVVRDNEGNWNLKHLDLPLSESSFSNKVDPVTDPMTYQAVQNDATIQHGTAVAGVIAGKNNGIGVTGMAPSATYQLAQIGGGWGDLLEYLIINQSTYADGGKDTHNVKPGDILLIEFQTALQGSNPKCKPTDPNTNPANGCVPAEGSIAGFVLLKDIVNYGGIVAIEAGGNGGVNLDTKKVNDGTGVIDFSKDSTGAIVVGASMGGSSLLNGKHTLEKAPYSNCGSRVDVFAWGAGVVTTGYGDHPISVKTDPNQAYTASFAGTSSAAAIIAGSAALLQQYAKQLYTDPKGACAIKTWEYIYLSSQQMRDVMVKSGTASKAYIADAQMWSGYQDPNPGCTIGVQPDLAKAMQIIKDGCDGKATGVKATVKTKDIVTYCVKPTLSNPNPTIPDWCKGIWGTLVQPPIAKMMDMDGDGRADLISFSKDRKWSVDLSSVGPTQFSGAPLQPGAPKDNFGFWNLTFDVSKDPNIAKDAMLFPVVMDYNTDGKADLGLYDAVHGKWVVHFTTGNTLNTGNAVAGVNPFPGWDMVIDYSAQPHWKPYSRPVPGDYDGQDNDPYTFDHYMDLALQTPDGWWLIDFGGSNPKANYGSFDQMENYLTGDQINEAPAWAWLPVVYLASYDNQDQMAASIFVKAPDNMSDAKIVNKLLWWSDDKVLNNFQKTAYGSNSDVYTQGKYQTKSYADIGMKKQYPDFGLWQVATMDSIWDDLINIDPYVNFGDINCRSIPGDYDGDGYDDRAVQCGSLWKIAYTGSKYPINSNKQSTIMLDGKQVTASETFRVVTLPAIQDPLPGYVYPGGVSFKDTKDIFATVSYLCPTVTPNGNTPPCTLLNMVPAPIGPYFPQCVDAICKTYPADVCTNPAKKVACETMRIQQAQCVYQ